LKIRVEKTIAGCQFSVVTLTVSGLRQYGRLGPARLSLWQLLQAMNAFDYARLNAYACVTRLTYAAPQSLPATSLTCG
jgi:hypothetical protein